MMHLTLLHVSNLGVAIFIFERSRSTSHCSLSQPSACSASPSCSIHSNSPSCCYERARLSQFTHSCHSTVQATRNSDLHELIAGLQSQINSLVNNIKSLRDELKECSEGHTSSTVPSVTHVTSTNTTLLQQDGPDTLENQDESIVSIEEFIDSELQPTQVPLNFFPTTTQQ